MTVVGLILFLSELRVYYQHDSSSEQLLFWSMVLIAGVFTVLFNDIVLGVLLGISLLMVVETVQLWDTPVWGKLMAATTVSYLVILLGKIGQMVYDYVVQPESPDEQIFSLAFNVAFYVFIAVAFYFFGKKFILVSRFSSPQMVYLFLFGVLYVFIAKFFPRQNDLVVSYNYLSNLGLDLGSWRQFVIFADFGTYESLTIVMIFMYFISGPLLTFLMGVKPVTDPEILAKVQEVAQTMGIEEEVKVGFVKAPILNAFAYGPWFDKRIAFISNELEDWTDEDIRGVVGHELAHAAHHHVLLLLLLSIGELALKKGLGLPATQLDYTLLPDNAIVKVTFAQYYIISYALLIFLLIFVRILEGHADKVTLEAGYGEDLSKALYRLEGFYNGVASDFGISVNLLTDRTYTPAEKRRFTAQAGRNLYNEVLTPTRMSAFANIFQSHPRTSYRIASLVDKDMDPVKGAFLPYRLLGFFMRKGAIKQLNSVREKFHNVLDLTYTVDQGQDALDEVRSYTPLKEPYEEYLDRDVVVFNQFDKFYKTGKATALKDTSRVTAPIQILVDNEPIDLAPVIIREYEPDSRYFLRNGQIGLLKNLEMDDEGLKFIMEFSKSVNGEVEVHEEAIPIQKIGKPVSYLEDLEGEKVLLFNKGITSLATLEKVELDHSFNNSTFMIDGETRKGSEFIMGFQPLGFEIRHEKIELQKPLLQYLVGKKVMVYNKENFDVALAGILKEVNEEYIIIDDPDKTNELEINGLEYALFSERTVEFITRAHVSLFTKMNVWWNNRTEFNYIF